MRLIEHVGRRESGRLALRRVNEFIEDSKQPKRINRPCVEIVVSVFGIIEMKTGELADANKTGDDLFDIHVWRVMAKVHKTNCLRSKRLRG